MVRRPTSFRATNHFHSKDLHNPRVRCVVHLFESAVSEPDLIALSTYLKIGPSSHLIHIMRLSSYPRIRLSHVILLIPSLAIAISLDCSDARDDGVSFNFLALKGPHSLYSIKQHPNKIINTTFTINICQPLRKQKDVSKEQDCPNGSRGRSIS